MRLSFQWVTGKQRFIKMAGRMRGPRAFSLIQRAVGRSAIAAQDHARDNLQSMVYDQPKAASGYIRTNTLMRGMSAFKSSRPDTGQHAKAASGIDLRATDPMEVVEVRGKNFRSSVGNPVNWAQKVHDGVYQGPDNTPRPFMDGVGEEYTNTLQDHIDDAWRAIGKI